MLIVANYNLEVDQDQIWFIDTNMHKYDQDIISVCVYTGSMPSVIIFEIWTPLWHDSTAVSQLFFERRWSHTPARPLWWGQLGSQLSSQSSCLIGDIVRWKFNDPTRGLVLVMARSKARVYTCCALILLSVIAIIVLIAVLVRRKCPDDTFSSAAVAADSGTCSDIGRWVAFDLLLWLHIYQFVINNRIVWLLRTDLEAGFSRTYWNSQQLHYTILCTL